MTTFLKRATAAICAAASAFGQNAPLRKPQQSDRSLDRGFSNIVGVRELRDGREIIADQLEAVVAVVLPTGSRYVRSGGRDAVRVSIYGRRA